MKILAIDTSGKTASAAVTDGGLLLAEKTVYTTLTHSQIILPMAKELLSDCGLSFSDLDGIACAAGPGSYTGLRIGIAAVKGIAMGCPTLKCAGISTLEALAWGCAPYRGRILPVMRARKDIVYAGLYESDGITVRNIFPDRVCAETELEAMADGALLLTGDCCSEIADTMFADREDIICAPSAMRLQKAASLCMAFEAAPARAVTPDELEAAYLQETKAEKDKAHRDK